MMAETTKCTGKCKAMLGACLREFVNFADSLDETKCELEEKEVLNVLKAVRNSLETYCEESDCLKKRFAYMTDEMIKESRLRITYGKVKAVKFLAAEVGAFLDETTENVAASAES